MSELPTLTDEQVDGVCVAAYPAYNPPDRTEPGWLRLRRAFPAPAPPRPEPMRGSCGDVWVEAGLTCVRVYVDAGVLNTAKAREVAAKLVECAEWVERHGKAGA